MLGFGVILAFAATLSALVVAKLLRRQKFLGGDLFWIATTTYLWSLTVVQGSAMAAHEASPRTVAGLDKTWLLVGGAALVLSTLVYSKVSWPPFKNPIIVDDE